MRAGEVDKYLGIGITPGGVDSSKCAPSEYKYIQICIFTNSESSSYQAERL